MHGHMMRTAVAALALVTTTALFAGPAEAKSDRRVEKHGNCSMRADWKLKVKTDDGRLEVEGEVDSNRRGQTWRWFFRHNGSVTARGVRQTAGRSGSFSVERKMVNLRGTDRIIFRAVRPATGEICRGVVNF